MNVDEVYVYLTQNLILLFVFLKKKQIIIIRMKLLCFMRRLLHRENVIPVQPD